MKKIALFICAIVVTATSITSCKKAYTCQCTSIEGKVETRDVIATNRTQAQKNCDEYGLRGHCDIK